MTPNRTARDCASRRSWLPLLLALFPVLAGAGQPTIMLRIDLHRGDTLIAAPRLLVHNAQPASIELDSGTPGGLVIGLLAHWHAVPGEICLRHPSVTGLDVRTLQVPAPAANADLTCLPAGTSLHWSYQTAGESQPLRLSVTATAGEHSR